MSGSVNMMAATQLRGGLRFLAVARQWFRAFRRTRPFWGAFWLTVGGGVVMYLNSYPIAMALSGGFNRSAGYILGGAMALFAVVALCSPIYARLVGFMGVLTAMAAFVGANLGGFVLGSVLGVIGGSMIWGWGELQPRRPRGSRRGRRTGSEA